MKTPRAAYLVSLDWLRKKDPPTSLGLASIVAHCHSMGLRPQYRSWACNNYVNDPAKLDSEVITWLEDSGAVCDPHALIGVGAFVWNEKHVQGITRTLAEMRCKAKVVLGGPQVSYTEAGSLEKYYPFATGFIRGSSEFPIADWLQGSELPSHGLHWAGSHDSGLLATAPLSALASPILLGLLPAQPFIRWETQRGCPFRCSFCQHAEPGEPSSVRNQTGIDRLSAEIRWICTNGISDVAVLDPVFNSGSTFLRTLSTLQTEGFRGKLSLQVRAEMAARQSAFLPHIEALQRQNGARVVLELGLQTAVREEMIAINRPNNVRVFAQFVAEAKQRGIATEVSLIYGLPGQTLSSFASSVEFARSLCSTRIHAFPLMLLRGTALHRDKDKLALREDFVELNGRVAPGIPVVVESPTFSRMDWEKMNAIAESL